MGGRGWRARVSEWRWALSYLVGRPKGDVGAPRVGAHDPQRHSMVVGILTWPDDAGLRDWGEVYLTRSVVGAGVKVVRRGSPSNSRVPTPSTACRYPVQIFISSTPI